MYNKVYIIGHKTPDIDSVVSAISYSSLKNKLENTDRYIPAVAGEINKATKFILEKFNFDIPEILENAKGENIILVDHNESSQSIDGMDEANILEILDHHKFNFSNSCVIEILVKSLGSTNSIIYEKYRDSNIELDKNLAGIMLSAVLDDTVITRSPTCTEIDKEIIKELSKKAEIENWEKYGLEIFNVKSSIAGMSARDVIKMDYKDFEFKSGRFGVGSIETTNLKEVEDREDEFKKDLENLRNEEGYHSVVLVAVDILKKGSMVLVSTNDEEKMNEALGAKLENNSVYIDGLMSRKKQVIPPLTNVFDK